MQLQRASEILAGLVLHDKVSAESVDPGIMGHPYHKLIKLLQDGGSEYDLIDDIGLHPVLIAKSAAEKILDQKDVDFYTYIEITQTAHIRAYSAEKLSSLLKSLRRGDAIDATKLYDIAGRLERGARVWTPGDEIEPEPMIYVPSHYPPLDNYVGGIPASGLTIVAGLTGTGKSTFLIELARRCARAKKKCAVLTLEMTMAQIMYRLIEVDPKITKKLRRNILFEDSIYTIDEVEAECARLAANHNLSFIGVDYADMLVGTREQSEAVMGRIYNGLSVLAKKIRTPIVLVAQYRRHDGAIPTINDIRYSGRAEQAASLILLLYNPNKVLSHIATDRDGNKLKSPLEHYPGRAYIILGKTRYRSKVQPTALGAVMVTWDENVGSWGKAIGSYPHAWEDLVGKV